MRGLAWVVLFVSTLWGAHGASAQHFGRNKVEYHDFDFRFLETEHFHVYYYPREEQAARIVARLAERWYARLSRVLGRHILPNATPELIVQGTFIFGYAILDEATLSFLGVGPPPPAPSWGNMLAEARYLIRDAFWISFFPGLLIGVAVLAANILGDGIRDRYDPRKGE